VFTKPSCLAARARGRVDDILPLDRRILVAAFLSDMGSGEGSISKLLSASWPLL
jgi:hypothetical protein